MSFPLCVSYKWLQGETSTQSDKAVPRYGSMQSQHSRHLRFNPFCVSSVDPLITATLTSILLKREYLQMNFQAGIKTFDRRKHHDCLTPHKKNQRINTQPRLFLSSEHLQCTLEDRYGEEIFAKGIGHVGRDVVLTYNVSFRCWELFVYFILCSF